jgi:hypothetical protein
VATEQDAARDRVLAARTDVVEQLELLEASAREAIDIPAKIRRSPAKSAAIAGLAGFLLLRGPQRLFRAGRRAVRGEPAPMPSRMLPEEVEKTLRTFGDDGDKVGAALERDFAEYARQASKDRTALKSVLLLAVARPLLARAARAAGDAIFSPDEKSFSERLARIRERARLEAERARGRADLAEASARERISVVRQDEAEGPGAVQRSGPGPADETSPTGI